MTTAIPEERVVFTADELEELFHAAVKVGDTRGVEAALTVPCSVDPPRAVPLYDDLKTALRMANLLQGGQR